jgi:hypothetical protein
LFYDIIVIFRPNLQSIQFMDKGNQYCTLDIIFSIIIVGTRKHDTTAGA